MGKPLALLMVVSTAAGEAVDTGSPSERTDTGVIDAGPSSDEHSTSSANGVSEPSEWYGWQVLLVDAAGIGAGLAAVNVAEFDPGTRPPPSGLFGGVWYGVGAVAAPTVHYAHGQTGMGFASFALRTLLPPSAGALGMVGNCFGNEFESGCISDGFVGGSLVGLVGASVVDIAFLSDPKPDRKPKVHRDWYGWQLLLMDGAALGGGAVLAATARNPEGERPHPGLALWVPGYVVGFFGGPIVHFAHGRWGTGFGSFGIRAGAGPLGVVPGVMGYCAVTGGTSGCARTGALWGLAGGLLAASAIDALVLAYEPADESAPAAYTPQILVAPGSVSIVGYLP